MLCHFEGGTRAPVSPCPPPSCPPPVAVMAAADCASPLQPLLQRLVGQQVAVIAGQRCVEGKLINACPVTLVNHCGGVTVISERVSSVQY